MKQQIQLALRQIQAIRVYETPDDKHDVTSFAVDTLESTLCNLATYLGYGTKQDGNTWLMEIL